MTRSSNGGSVVERSTTDCKIEGSNPTNKHLLQIHNADIGTIFKMKNIFDFD